MNTEKKKTKVDLVTGFLGAGKTTFIKKYARYLLDKGCKIGVLENDFGAVNVDMLLLQELLDENCDLEMVSAADKDCHRRRFKTKLIAMGMRGVNTALHTARTINATVISVLMCLSSFFHQFFV